MVSCGLDGLHRRDFYHDTHFGLGLKMFQGDADTTMSRCATPVWSASTTFFLIYKVLLSTDAFFREIARQEEFQHSMGSAEFHYRAGRYVAATRARAQAFPPLFARVGLPNTRCRSIPHRRAILRSA